MAQFLRPDGTISSGGWSANGAATLHECTNQAVASHDADSTAALTGGNPVNDAMELSTGNPSGTPGSGDHIIRAAWRKNASGGRVLSGKVDVVQGTTVIATLTNSDITNTFVTDTYTLSSAEVANITDYNDLRLRVTANDETGSGATRRLSVTAVELEVPDASGGGNVVELAASAAIATLTPAGALSVSRPMAAVVMAQSDTSVATLEVAQHLIEMLVDDFDDDTHDPAVWEYGIVEFGGTSWEIATDEYVSRVNGRVEIAIPASLEKYTGYKSVQAYDLTNSGAFVELTSVTMSATLEGPGVEFHVARDTNNLVSFVIESNGSNVVVRLRHRVGGTNTNVATLTYSATDHRWLRIRHDGSQIRWDTSPDGLDWTLRASWTPTFDITEMRVNLKVGNWWNQYTGDIVGHYDNLNVAPQAPVDTDYDVGEGNLFFSPGNWYKSDVAYAQTNNPGAYLKGEFDGTGLTVRLDTSMLNATQANNPIVAWRVDGGSLSEQQLTNAATTDIVVASGLTDALHTFEFFFRGTNVGQDRWSTPTNVVRVTQVTVAGGTLVAPALATKRWLVYGDSISEGVNVDGTNYSAAVQDAANVYGLQFGEQNDAEVGVIAFNGQGWEHNGNGNVPHFHDPASDANTTWNKHWSGQSRDFSEIDAVFVAVGTNDEIGGEGPTATAVVEARVQDFLVEFRAANPTIPVYLIDPYGGFSRIRGAIETGFQAAAVSESYHVSTSHAALEADMDDTGGTTGTYSHDDIHPNQAGHDLIAELLDLALHARPLSASIPALSTTPTPSLLVSRPLAAAAAAQSDTPAAALPVARPIIAVITSQSATAQASLPVARPLAADNAFQSATAPALLAVSRPLTAGAAFQSATPDVVILAVSGLVELAAQIAASSDTAAARLVVSRSLTAGAALQSVTPDTVALTISGLIELASSMEMQSQTALPSLAISRPLASTAAWQSETAVPSLIILRLLAATMPLQGATSVAGIAVSRALSAGAAMQSETPDAVILSISGLIQLTAQIAAGSATAIARLAIMRPLAGNVPGQSATPEPTLSVARLLAAAMTGESMIPDDTALLVSRALSAAATLQTVTPDVVVLSITGEIVLVASMALQSATGLSRLTVARSLAADAPAQSGTPQARLSVARSVAASMPGESVTSEAATLLMARALSAVATMQSATPDAVVLSISGLIQLAASITMQSGTGSPALAVARSLVADAAVQSETAGNLVLVVIRHLTAAAPALSATADEVDVFMSRALSAAMAAQGNTAYPTLAVDRPLGAVVPVQSATPDGVDLTVAQIAGLITVLLAGRSPVFLAGSAPGVSLSARRLDIEIGGGK